MPVYYRTLKVYGTREEIRRQVITAFLDEHPGSGKGENCSKYIYNVETLSNGDSVFLKRPATLNKGMDFTVHVEKLKFREKGMTDMPSHKNVIEDLIKKKDSNPIEYEKVKIMIDKLYKCHQVDENEYTNLLFNTGFPIEAILKSIKWLFIEQDVTYWNWSGRNMLYSALIENDLC
ncbi:hypothetical protein SAMN05443428_12820 [Caloramator quimbayensis]|uniref:DNA adenine methylase n=1 Tax=Caloramator quimbayensis TaxID=1147123 RepID=A0A1T4Y945_9CLOT|nr:hypothetical protein [Caloramator quimbayensis]SKA98309.1 hypothetical protein SAMN05443428_12820 [Caloramator quimbayensis]